MTKMMRKLTAFALALLLITGQLATVVTAASHDDVEQQVETQLENQDPTPIPDQTVQEEVLVSGNPVPATPESNTSVALIEVTAPEVVDPNASVSGTEESQLPEEDTEGGNQMYDADGNPISQPPAPVEGTEINGGLVEGQWQEVEGSEAAAPAQDGTWEQTPGSTLNEEDEYVSGTYENVNGQLKADVTDGILKEIGFTDQEVADYHAANSTTSIDTLKNLLQTKADQMNAQEENIKNGVTYTVVVEQDPTTGEYNVQFQKFTLTKEAAEYDLNGNITQTNNPEFEKVGEVVFRGELQEYEFDNTKDTAHMNAEGAMESYSRTSTEGTVPAEGSTADYDYTITDENIKKNVDEDNNVSYDVTVTKTQNKQTTRTLEQALTDGIITQEDVDKLVADEDAAQSRKNNLSDYYIDPTPASGLSGATLSASANVVTVDLNDKDVNNKLTGSVSSYVLPVYTATGTDANGNTVTETYTPAVLDGNLVYQVVSQWTDRNGQSHAGIDYIYGELQKVTESYDFVQDENGAGTVVTKTTITTVQDKHIQASRKEETYEKELEGTGTHEGITVGTLSEFAFSVGADGKSYFTLNGTEMEVVDTNSVINQLRQSSATYWEVKSLDPTGFRINNEGSDESILREFVVKDGNGRERRVHCIERGVSAPVGGGRNLTEPGAANGPTLSQDLLNKYNTIATHGYWRDDPGSLDIAKQTLRDYLNTLDPNNLPEWAVDARNDDRFMLPTLIFRGKLNVNAIVNQWLTKSGAVAATQWALWEAANGDLENYDVHSSMSHETDFAVEALKVALMKKAENSPTPPPESASAAITGIDFKAEVTETTTNVDGVETSVTTNKTYNGEQVYGADVMFTLDMDPQSLTGNTEITVTGIDGQKSNFVLQKDNGVLSWVGGTMSGLTGSEIVKADGEGNYILKNVEVAKGVTIDITLVGTQNMGKGMVIYYNEAQGDFISLGNKTNNVNLKMTMEFTEDLDGQMKLNSGEAQRIDTKTVDYERTDTRTDIAEYFTVVTDPGKKNTENVSNVTVKGRVEKLTMSAGLSKEFAPLVIDFDVPTVTDDEPAPMMQGEHADCSVCTYLTTQESIRILGRYWGVLTVKIPVDEAYEGKDITVAWCENGRLVTRNVTVADGYVTFTTDSPHIFYLLDGIYTTHDGQTLVPQTI